jgi:hypothetical protein
MRMDFGGWFAYKEGAAHPGKLSEGEQHGQENLEEVEEDPTDQAVDGWCGQEVVRISIEKARSSRAQVPAKAIFNSKRGRYPSGSGPFCVCCDLISARFPLPAFPNRDWREVIGLLLRVLKFSTGDD